MLIRVRTNVGVWRIDNLNAETAKASDILSGIAQTRPMVQYLKPLSLDPGCNEPIDESATLKSLKLGHGAMVHCRVDASTCADTSTVSASNDTDTDTAAPSSSLTSSSSSAHMKRIIGSDGSIKLIHDASAPTSSSAGFRKGMLPLRDMKMQWTLQEFVDMDEQFVFRIKRQEERWVGSGGVSLDTDSANAFQAYLRTFQFRRHRFGFLYGRFVDEEEEEEKKDKQTKDHDTAKDEPPKNKKVIVEAIYEPPQEADPEAAEGFTIPDDPEEDKIEQLANMLGLTKVGWIFGHSPREEGFQMSAAEILMAAEFQLEAASGVHRTPFVTVKVTVGDDGNASFEAFQVSRQCMEMVAEEAIQIGPNPGFCYVHETFTAIQEGKESKTIDNNFFLTVVPIVQHSSEVFVSQFPRANRDHDPRQPSHDEMKKQLAKSGTAGWTFIDLLADFHLLIYLSKFLDFSSDIPSICQSVVDRDIPLDEGYKLIIASMAGLDGSY